MLRRVGDRRRSGRAGRLPAPAASVGGKAAACAARGQRGRYVLCTDGRALPVSVRGRPVRAAAHTRRTEPVPHVPGFPALGGAAVRPGGAWTFARVPGGRTAAAGAHGTPALCLRAAAGRRLCGRCAGAAADRRRHGGARPGARAVGAAGAYGGGKPRGGARFCPCGTAPARPAPHCGVGLREGAGDRCSTRTHGAGGAGAMGSRRRSRSMPAGRSCSGAWRRFLPARRPE